MSQKNRKTKHRFISRLFKIVAYALLVGGVYVGITAYISSKDIYKLTGSWQACNQSPQECQKLLLQHIDEAKESIRFQANSFTNADMGEALIKAHHRHVHIEVILDESNLKAKNPLLKKLITNKICLRIEKLQENDHNKIIIIDEQISIRGSYDFSKREEKEKVETMFISHDPLIAKEYNNSWQKNWNNGINPSQIGCRVKLTPLKS